MYPILIFRHIACEGAGFLADVCQQNAIPYQLIAVDNNEAIPTNINHCSALVFMGGPMSVNDQLAWMTQEIELIQQAVQAQLPILGHCLGAQLIAKALGAEITTNPVKEIGWHNIKVIQNQHPAWLKQIPNELLAFHWHGETFSLPKQAQLLFSSDCCQNQAFALGNILAFQFHLEITQTMPAEWSQLYQAELTHPSKSIQTAAQMTMDLTTKIKNLQTIASIIYQNWLQLVIKNELN